MVEQFNQTLKAMLRKHAARFEKQWDQYLSSVLWAYRNTPHDSTREKPSFLLIGWDLRSPTEAAFVKPTNLSPSTEEDYQEEVTFSLTSAHQLAVQSVEKASNVIRSITIVMLSQLSVELVTGSSSDSQQRRQGGTGNCHTHGMVPTVLCLKGIRMLYFPEVSQIKVHRLGAP